MSTQQHRWILSGGLASGKSMVRQILERQGIATIDADRIGHQVLESKGPAFPAVAARWPQAVREGAIDRRALAETVFGDPGELAELESITHPHIFDSIRVRVEEIDGPVVVEVPLLEHRLGDEWRLMVVDSHEQVRLARAIERGMEREDAEARMRAQPSRAEWLAAADLVMPNHDSVSDLEEAASIVAAWLVA